MRKVVLVSLDAFFDADFQYLRPDGGLTKMIQEGSVCRQVKTVFPALTYPAHVTLITGCDPVDTHVGQNQPYQPETPGKERVWYWERKHIAVPTLFDAVKNAGGKNCSVLWPVCCKNPTADWCFPEVHPLLGENVVLKTLRYGTPLFVLDSERRFGSLRQGISEPGLSDYAAAITAQTIRKKKPDLTAVHLIDLDEMRHHHGVFSKEAISAIQRNEDRLNQIRKAMEETPGMENALLIAVSDHGQSDISKTINLTESLQKLGLADDFGVQSNGESAYFFAKRQNADVENALAVLQDHLAENGILRLYSRADLDRMNAVKEVAFACEAADQVVFSDGLDEGKREKATHGFGPGHKAENCLFAVWGKGIRAGYEMPVMPMRDVAPTIAGLMGIALPKAKGIDHSREIIK
ncbi:MAG: alkaline phosphatase family protein [Clostridia bacterium]|nr:alkaline phosphatase family protein [Clostridia bacterium]